MPKVSVLVPVYGVEKFIERCARSLFEQTMAEGVEYVFVNDCTKDQSIEILEAILEDYPHRKPFVKIIHHEINKGLGATRNTSIDHATGDYICIVDSDDYVELNMLEVMYNKAIKTEADIVVCLNYYTEYKNKIIKNKLQNINEKEKYLINILKGASAHTLWAKIYKRNIFEEYNLRVPQYVAGYAEDLALTPKLFYHAEKVYFIKDFLYHYTRINDKSYTNNVSIEDTKTRIMVTKYLENCFKNKGQVYTDAIELNKIQYSLSCITFFIWNSKLQRKVFNLFKDLNYLKYYSELSLKSRIIYIMAKYNFFKSLNILLYIYKKIK